MAGGAGQGVEALQQAAGERYSYPFGWVVEQGGVQREDTEEPAGVGGVLAQSVQAGSGWYGLTCVEGCVDPGGGGFLGGGHGFVERVAGGESAGQVRDNNAKGRNGRARFDCDVVTHWCLPRASLNLQKFLVSFFKKKKYCGRRHC